MGPAVNDLPTETVTSILQEWRHGDEGALARLMPLVYDELRRRAAEYLRHERPDHTLQAAALVHEAYLKLRLRRRRGAAVVDFDQADASAVVQSRE